MRTIIVLILALSLAATAASATPLQVPFKTLPATELTFQIGGQEPQWTQEALGKDKARYTWQNYILQLKLENKGIQRLLSFSIEPPKGAKLAVDSYGAKITVPQSGLHSVLVPNVGPIGNELGYYHQHNKWREGIPLYRCLLPQGFEQQARANTDAPFILLSDNKGRNGLSAGWGIVERCTMLKSGADNSNYWISLSRSEDIPFAGDKVQDTLIVSQARQSWFDVEREYAKTFDNINNRHHDPLPEWVFDPVFCTWYCYLHEINQKLVLDSARKCKDLGIDTYLIDAGWDARPGSWWGDLDNGILGDFIVGVDRFPDLAGAIKQMHEMGLRVQLWSAPFWQARQSKTYLEKTKSWHIWGKDGESYDLCPKYPGTRGLFLENYSKIARTLGVDGMWLDVMDAIPDKCLAPHEHIDKTMGNAVVDCMAAVREGLRSVKPDAITEARTMHANINTKRALDVMACGDTPENYENIRLANLHLRPWAYDVVLKNDPMIWPKNSSAATVGKFMATNICSGVPALSVDFLTATEEQCAIAKAYLSFYKKHKKTLIKGQFKLFGENYAIPDMMFIGDREAIVYLKNIKTTEVVLPRRVNRAIILNCSDSDRLSLQVNMTSGKRSAQAYKPTWTVSAPPDSFDAAEAVQMIVPVGGAVVVSGT